MLLSIFSQAIISLIIILVLHNLFLFFKDNLTTPKIKDLVTKPNEEYKKIYSKLNSSNNNSKNSDEKEKRKNELIKYMRSLSKNKNTDKGDNNKGDTNELGNNISNIKNDNMNNSYNKLESFDINSTNNFSSF